MAFLSSGKAPWSGNWFEIVISAVDLTEEAEEALREASDNLVEKSCRLKLFNVCKTDRPCGILPQGLFIVVEITNPAV